ncbi:MAG TPA: thiamine pyrophosphate-binding protein, partial [Candidatus Latescibacteria bacterium]|nr:thiamine pyrophosphate-binding protein [Candidatus Latescibacterota bacterium]
MEGKECTGAEILVECIIREGVDLMFGYPGGVVLKVFDELYSRRDQIRVVLPRHEQAGVHAADGWAKVTGK